MSPEYRETPFNIDYAQPEDVEGIVSVLNAAWLETYPNPELGITKNDILAKIGDAKTKIKRIKEFLKTNRENENVIYLVSKERGRIIGFMFATKGKEDGMIQALYIAPSNQRRGIGSKLMENALFWLNGVNHISVNVVSYNYNAIKFYEKFGFTYAGPTSSGFGVLPNNKIIPEIKMVRSVVSQVL